jgi:hypothetical protein
MDAGQLAAARQRGGETRCGPAETVAVLRFTGVRGPPVVAARTEELLCALQGSGFQDLSALTAWFNHPPWTLPCLRRNEIALPVTAR